MPEQDLQLLADASARVASTSSRKEKISIIGACLHALDPGIVGAAAELLAGELPGGRIGIGPALVIKAKETPPAESPSLAIADVPAELKRISAMSGKGSGHRRHQAIVSLLGRATELEQSFLFYLLIGDLRQGASRALVAEGIAAGAELSPGDVRRALMLCGSLSLTAETAFRGGGAALAAIAIEVFRPVLPMLAKPASDMEEAASRLEALSVEYKLDGARIQVHKRGDEVRVYSRLQTDVSVAVPEIVEQARGLAAEVLVLDGEAICFRDDGIPQPFQVTMRRFGRKADPAELRQELPIRAVYFDVLHDGTSLVDESLEQRQRRLDALVPKESVVPRLLTQDVEKAIGFMQNATQAGHEGVMCKSPRSLYQAGARGESWLKVKPVYTLDLVVLGAEWGSGRRRGYLSNLHLGALDPVSGDYVMLGKTFKGLTDELLAWQTEELSKRELSRSENTVFVKPDLVVEIAFNDVQVSTKYPGGVALRFARVRGYRQDKTAAQADTLDAVRALVPKMPKPT